MAGPLLAWAVSVTVLGLTLPTALAEDAGPAIATRWQKVKVSQERCLQQAQDVLSRSGFGQLERTQQSRYGTLAQYTAGIRCITSNGLAIFIVSGPSRAQSDQMAGALFQNWR